MAPLHVFYYFTIPLITHIAFDIALSNTYIMVGIIHWSGYALYFSSTDIASKVACNFFCCYVWCSLVQSFRPFSFSFLFFSFFFFSMLLLRFILLFSYLYLLFLIIDIFGLRTHLSLQDRHGHRAYKR